MALRHTQMPVTQRATKNGDDTGPDSQGIKRGRICLVCDRKFMLYDYYGEFACQVEEMDCYIKDEK